jgi:hypothetical protein
MYITILLKLLEINPSFLDIFSKLLSISKDKVSKTPLASGTDLEKLYYIILLFNIIYYFIIF